MADPHRRCQENGWQRHPFFALHPAAWLPGSYQLSFKVYLPLVAPVPPL